VIAWDSALRVNLTAPFIMAQEAREALSASEHGVIVLFSSIYGMVGPDMSLYAGTLMANPAGYNARRGACCSLPLPGDGARALRARECHNARRRVAQQPDSSAQRYEARTPLRRMTNGRRPERAPSLTWRVISRRM